MDGTETLLTKHPRRTIIGNASFADPWFTAGGTAIGVPTVRSQQALPEQARNLPRIGALRSLNLERIYAMKPDLVLINANLHAHRAVRHHLIDAEIPNVALDYANFHDYAGIPRSLLPPQRRKCGKQSDGKADHFSGEKTDP